MASSPAAQALNRQLRLTGSEKSIQFRATKLSMARINTTIPSTPKGIAP
jgi:hypothetical protein